MMSILFFGKSGKNDSPILPTEASVYAGSITESTTIPVIRVSKNSARKSSRDVASCSSRLKHSWLKGVSAAIGGCQTWSRKRLGLCFLTLRREEIDWAGLRAGAVAGRVAGH
jgi:hypothetical protein